MTKFPRAALATGLAMCMLGIAGCGGGSGDNGSGDAITIDYWTENAGEATIATMKTLVEQFNKDNPGINVKVRYVTTEFRPVIRNAFSAGNPPEIFDEEGYNDLFDYVVEDQIEDVTDWFNEPGNGDRFAESTVASVTYDGKIYAVPELTYTANSIWYNKKILDENGIDPASLTTWDDMLGAFETLKGNGVAPLAFPGKDGWPGSEWYYAFVGKLAGGEYLKQLSAGNCGYKWTDDVSVQAAQMFVDLNDNGYFQDGAASTDFATANAVFLSGKSAFYMMGNWFTGDVLGSPNKDDFGMLTFPDVPGGAGGQESQLVAPQGLALTTAASDPEVKEAALTFIDYLTSTEQSSELAKTGLIMSNPDANTSDSLDPLSLQIAEEQIVPANNSYPFGEHMTTKAVGEDAIWKGSTGVLTGTTAEEWMASVQAADDETQGENSFKLEENCG